MSEKNIMSKKLTVTMSDYSVWEIPIEVIAKSRAEFYAKCEFDGDVEKSLKEDTLPAFEADAYKIIEWAEGNMNWEDVKEYAIKVKDPNIEEVYKEDWMNGPKEIV